MSIVGAASDNSIFGMAPETWCVDRIRDRLENIVGGEWGDDPDAHDEGVEIPVIRVADIRGLDVATDDLTIRRVKETKLLNRLIGSRTVLIEKSGGGELQPVGRAVLGRNIKSDAICSNFMAKTDCGATVIPSFMAYLLDASYSCGINKAHIQQTTGIQNLRVTDYLNTKAPFPPLSEQQRIAAYLDASCKTIDAAVATKEKQIDILEELYRAELHSAFDRPEWLHERVKDVTTKIGSGVTPEGGAANYLDEGIPLLRSQNVHFDGLRLEDVAFISPETHADMFGSQIKPQDVLLNITGASIGRCTYVPDGFGEGNVNQHVCIIRPNHQIYYRFLAAYLSSPLGQSEVFSGFTGASRQGLGQRDLGSILVPLPTLDVQLQVVAKIEKQTRKNKEVRAILEKQIATLSDYRKSLIHECVTGQRRITEADLERVQAHA